MPAQSELAQKASKRREFKLQEILQRANNKPDEKTKDTVTVGMDAHLQSATVQSIVKTFNVISIKAQKDEQISTERNESRVDNSEVASKNKKLFLAEKHSWSTREQTLIAWYNSLQCNQLPKSPFKIVPHITVTSDKFYETISNDIKTGPNGPHSRLGYLESKLDMLSKYMNTDP